MKPLLSRRAIGGALMAIGALASVPVVYALHGAMGYNPLRLPLEDKMNVRLFLPEGWRFFTRDAREEQTAPFLRGSDGAWRSASAGVMAEPHNLFGASRRARVQGMELSLLLEDVPASAWESCPSAPDRCLAGDPVRAVRNPSPIPSLCGMVGLVRAAPVPWAWAHHPPTMPSRVLRLDVQC